MDWTREIRRRVADEALRVVGEARELAPRVHGPLFSSVYAVPVSIDPTIVERGVIDVPDGTDHTGILNALRESAEKGVRAPLIVTRSADGAPVVERACPHEQEIDVDLVVTGEVVARYCAACGRTAYMEGW